MKPVLRSNLFFMILIIVQISGSFLLKPILRAWNLPVYFTLILGEVLFLLIPSIIYLIITKSSVKNTLRLNKINIPSIAIIIILGLVSQPIATFFALISSLLFKNNVTTVFTQIKSLPLGVLVCVMAVTPAICEEIAMRGIVFSGYKAISIKKAALITGLMFGIMHLNPVQFLYAFALGILFAYIVHITNSIFSSMICHFIFNGWQTVLSWGIMKFSSNINQDTAGAIKTMNKSLMFSALTIWFVLAAFFTAIIIALLRVLRDINIKKVNSEEISTQRHSEGLSTINDEKISLNLQESFYSKENILNWPFFVTVILYIAFIAINFSSFKA